jgi:hypothetical protein
MTDTSLPSARFAERDFRAGEVFNRTFSVLSRNLLPFGIMTAVAALPNTLLFTPGTRVVSAAGVAGGGLFFLGLILTMVLTALTQAAVLYGAFEDMRGRPVNVADSIKIGLARFFPVLGVAICVPILAALGAVALFFPGLMVITMLFVAMPVCVVERLGPIKSMGRSARLTKGHRWKVFGIWLAMTIVTVIAQSILVGVARAIGGTVLALVASLLWGAVYGAFYAILVVVTYHDLRVAKEGVNTDQIASVFD